jgi:glutamate transport system permease protein
MLLMLGRICDHRPIAWLATAVIEITRGIPTLLFIYFFLLVPSKLGLRLDAYWKLTLPVAISACGVVAEVLRSGVNSVPKGQREAALSLGMQSSHVFAKIIFPQAFRYVVPSLIAELVIVLKDTTFAYVVNYADLMQNAKVLISNYDALVSVYFVIAVIYILINYILNRISERISRRMNLSVKVK